MPRQPGNWVSCKANPFVVEPRRADVVVLVLRHVVHPMVELIFKDINIRLMNQHVVEVREGGKEVGVHVKQLCGSLRNKISRREKADFDRSADLFEKLPIRSLRQGENPASSSQDGCSSRQTQLGNSIERRSLIGRNDGEFRAVHGCNSWDLWRGGRILLRSGLADVCSSIH